MDWIAFIWVQRYHLFPFILYRMTVFEVLSNQFLPTDVIIPQTWTRFNGHRLKSQTAYIFQTIFSATEWPNRIGFQQFFNGTKSRTQWGCIGDAFGTWGRIEDAFGMPWKCIGNLEMHWRCIGDALEMHWGCIGVALGMYLECIGMHWECMGLH